MRQDSQGKVTGKLENIPKTKPGLGAETEPGNKAEKKHH
jgi:hypothetical protein